MAELTVEQFNRKLDNWVRALEEQEIPMIIAVKDTIAQMSVRIFDKGLAADGSKIVSYDTVRELWVSDSQLPRAGTHTGKTGNPIKTSYYENYKALREQQGRQSGFVNLKLTNRLQSEFLNRPLSENITGDPNPHKTGELEYAVGFTTEGKKKADGNEKRFGKKIFEASKDEIDNFVKVFLFEWESQFDEA